LLAPQGSRRTQTPTQMPLFTPGTHVTLKGLRQRDTLNGEHAVVVDADTDGERCTVKLDSGKSIRVRPCNLTRWCAHHLEPATDEEGAQVTDGENTVKRYDDDSDTTDHVADPTLFVVDGGRFVQPGAPSAEVKHLTDRSTTTADAREHRLHLPAGHWAVRVVEVDGDRVRATLMATRMEGATKKRDVAWNDLQGHTLTRTVQGSNDEDVASPDVAVTVSGGDLIVIVPMKRTSSNGERERDEERESGEDPFICEVACETGKTVDDYKAHGAGSPTTNSQDKAAAVGARARKENEVTNTGNAESCTVRMSAKRWQARAEQVQHAQTAPTGKGHTAAAVSGVNGLNVAPVCASQPGPEAVEDPEAVERWTDGELANVRVPPVCVLGL